jgi:tetratricopeptide (TPR) repeat protein
MKRRERKKQQKKKERQERLRQEKHQRHASGWPADVEEDYGPELEDDQPPDLQIGTSLHSERMLRELQQAISERGIESEEELQALMAEFNQAGPAASASASRKADPRAMAQDLAYQAMESSDPAAARQLASEALEYDPDCVDALATVAELTATTLEDLLRRLEQAVQAGERSLGAACFEEHRGHFWGVVETRPYMRVRARLADLLRSAGRWDAAISHYEAMLELNPNDNQGLRDSLLGCYLAIGNLAGARRLFERYGKAGMAVFAWGSVLERYLSGQSAEAAGALKKARMQNRHVEAYLTGQKPLPRTLPAYFSVGQESEGIHAAALLEAAWRNHPQALQWLRTSKTSAGAAAAQRPNLFANEHSQRWLARFLADEKGASILEALDIVQVLRPGVILNEKTCWEILTAAEIVAAGRGQPSGDVPESVIRWLVEQDLLFSPGVISMASAAVAQVWSASELKNHWLTSGEADTWRPVVEGLQKRLRVQ